MKQQLRLLVLLVVLTATGVAIARSDPAAIGRALAAMSWRWAVIAAVINLLNVGVDAARLRIIVRAFGSIGLWHAVQAQLVGITGSVLFPLKLGEAARAYMLTRRHEVPAATAMTMVVLDRVMDAVVLPLFVVIASVVLPMPATVLRYRTWMLMSLAGAIAAGVVIGRWLRLRHAGGQAAALTGTLDRIIAGIAILADHGRLASAVAASLVSWTARAAILWCMLHAFDLALPLSATVSTLVIVNLGIAVVATPGNVGTFELAAAAALAFWGVPSQTALSVGIATHIVEVVPPVLLGLLVGRW